MQSHHHHRLVVDNHHPPTRTRLLTYQRHSSPYYNTTFYSKTRVLSRARTYSAIVGFMMRWLEWWRTRWVRTAVPYGEAAYNDLIDWPPTTSRLAGWLDVVSQHRRTWGGICECVSSLRCCACLRNALFFCVYCCGVRLSAFLANDVRVTLLVAS